MSETKKLDKIEMEVPSLTGVSNEDLQMFLENHTGINPDEEAQGSVFTIAISIAMHC